VTAKAISGDHLTLHTQAGSEAKKSSNTVAMGSIKAEAAPHDIEESRRVVKEQKQVSDLIYQSTNFFKQKK
jgi:hypothetical protein